MTKRIAFIVVWTVLFQMYTGIVLAANVIKVASIFSLTGTAAAANASTVRAVRYAVDDINSHGGVLGRPIQLIEFDNRSTPIGSKVAADSAWRAGVVAIIGSAFSSHSMAVARVAQQRRIPMISTISTHPQVTRIGSFIFRVCFNDLLQSRVMARFAREDRQLARAVIFTDLTSDYSVGLTADFQKEFEKLGGTVVRKINYKVRQATDYQKLVQQIADLSPDALFIPGHDESALIINAARQIGLKAIPLGADGWDTESFYRLGGRRIPEAYFTTHWTAEADDPQSRRFVEQYRQKTSSGVYATDALAVDAVNLLADAISRAGSADPQAIRKALADTKTFEGITGQITMNPHGDPLKPAVIIKIDDGKPRYLKQVQPYSMVSQ